MAEDDVQEHPAAPSVDEAPPAMKVSASAMIAHLNSRAGQSPASVYAKALKAAHGFQAHTPEEWQAKIAAIAAQPTERAAVAISRNSAARFAPKPTTRRR